MKRKIVKLKLGKRTYPINIGVPLEHLGYAIKPHKPSKILVITNSMVYGFHGKRLLQGLKHAGFEPVFTMVPDGEQYKTIEQTSTMYRSCIKAGLDRNSMIIGFGGGVIGDLAGFTGATYMRGVQVVQVPTTLLAMVDSSIGGKTGVDLPEGKNLIGSFYQPHIVWIDPTVLKTLQRKQWCNGMAEIIKYGIIADRRFFDFLMRVFGNMHETSTLERFIRRAVQKYPFHITPELLEKIITRSCEIKARVVEEDEKEEKGIREILNFGHTFGHALETLTHYLEYQYGEAVALGMVMAGRVAHMLDMFKEQEKIEKIIQLAELPMQVKKPINEDNFINIMKKDKKARYGKMRLVLPTTIGTVEVNDQVPEKVIRSVIANIHIVQRGEQV